jgi:esterase/lipase superfamily enzyme
VPNITDKRLLRALHQMEIIIVVGSDDPFLENTVGLSRALQAKGIVHEVVTWSGRAHSARYWREMVRIYL